MSKMDYVFLRAQAEAGGTLYGNQRALDVFTMDGLFQPFNTLAHAAWSIQNEMAQEHGVAVQDLVWDFWEYEYYTEAM